MLIKFFCKNMRINTDCLLIEMKILCATVLLKFCFCTYLVLGLAFWIMECFVFQSQNFRKQERDNFALRRDSVWFKVISASTTGNHNFVGQKKKKKEGQQSKCLQEPQSSELMTLGLTQPRNCKSETCGSDSILQQRAFSSLNMHFSLCNPWCQHQGVDG